MGVNGDAGSLAKERARRDILRVFEGESIRLFLSGSFEIAL